MVNDFFEHNNDFDDDDDRVRFAKNMLQEYRFLYKDADGDNLNVRFSPTFSFMSHLFTGVSWSILFPFHSTNIGYAFRSN